MRAVASILATMAALLGACSTAQAQSSDSESFVFFGGVAGASLDFASITQADVLVSGNVYVEYRGTPDAGCATHGVCGISGTLVWEPGRHGQLVVERVRIHGKVKLIGDLGFYNASNVTHTRRESASGPTGLCGDIGTETLGTSIFSRGISSSLHVGLGDAVSGFATTHCPGPLDSDVLRLLPIRPLRHSVIKHGRGSVDLSTTRPFRAGGFSGVLHSTVTLKFGKPRRPRIPSFGDIKFPRLRIARARYRIDRVSGSLTAAFGGVSDPSLCMPLDACGVTGTITQSLPRGTGEFELSTLAPASRPKRDLLRAIGVSTRGSLKGLGAEGLGVWKANSGTLQATVKRDDGSAPCSDSLPMRTGFLFASVTQRGLRLDYVSDAFRTRCEGPLETDLAGDEGLASGHVPLSALRHRRVTIRLRTGAKFSGGAYSGTTQPALTVTLTRTGFSSRVVSFP